MKSSQSDIDLVVTTSRRLEALLETRLGAEGRGLHEKLEAVEDQLDEDAVRSGRYVATMRNKVVHEDGFALPDRARFLRSAAALEKAVAGSLSEAARLAMAAHFPPGVIVSASGLLGYMALMGDFGHKTAHPERNFDFAAALMVVAILPAVGWLRLEYRRQGRRFTPLKVLIFFVFSPFLPFFYIPIELGRYVLSWFRQAISR